MDIEDQKNNVTQQRVAMLIFLSPYKMTEFDIEKFGLRTLREKKIYVQIFDLSLLVFNNRPKAKYSKIDIDFHEEKIYSLKEFEEKIKEKVPYSIFIDNINCYNGILWDKNRHIFRILKKYNAKYYVVETGSLPIHFGDKVALLSKSRNLIRKIKSLRTFLLVIKVIYSKFASYFLSILCKRRIRYQLPEKIFTSETELLSSYLKRYQLSRDKVVPIHSFDYDKYISYRSYNLPEAPNEKICVFIDQAPTHHPDYVPNSLNGHPLSHNMYFNSINRYFDKIEKETGLKVIIAAHPRSRYEEDFPDAFGSRVWIKNNTINLIAKSALVITHCSTAVSFAVLFNKPILIISTNEMLLQMSFLAYQRAMSEALGVKLINIDDEGEFNSLPLSSYIDWPRNYESYKYKYLKSYHLENKTVWEIVAEHVKMTTLNSIANK